MPGCEQPARPAKTCCHLVGNEQRPGLLDTRPRTRVMNSFDGVHYPEVADYRLHHECRDRLGLEQPLHPARGALVQRRPDPVAVGE